MIHASLHAIGRDAGHLFFQVLLLTLVVGSLALWARRLLRRLKHTMGGRR
jgi:hypothetical protein